MNTTKKLYTQARFTFNYPANVPKRNINCPNCKQSNCFTPFYDNATGLILTDYGICNRLAKCGYRSIPAPGAVPTVANGAVSVATRTAPNILLTPETPTNYNIKLVDSYCAESKTKLFTVIEPSLTLSKDGNQVHRKPKALAHLSLAELVELLNNLPADSAKNKLLRPNILKGLYPIGSYTLGANCAKTAPFLFFDIDKSNNTWLSDKAETRTVYDFLNENALFTAFSNSCGIFGCFYVPKLAEFDNDTRSEHKRVGTQVYAFVSEMAQMLLGINIVFDYAQATFRQVRLLAYQSETVKLNRLCKEIVLEPINIKEFC